MNLLKSTYGKNGLLPLQAIECTSEFHSQIRQNPAQWQSDVTDQKVWQTGVNEALHVGLCVYCGSMIAKVLPIE